ncbi:hypothetical protein IAE60_15025 [Pseudoxanthomonas mexicana]|uniref:Uncharacterized protein n=1 Tax=Pseudoxanthomonas mexicana TaxID=128785 RepID=A0A7G9TAU6_PSEMX|nr:hypothetical protein [Pseudoxanthomonas mexicana]QNN77221.1 hypothetical protein IAE60_15025 [Pseudoxanthomonas mexicana]
MRSILTTTLARDFQTQPPPLVDPIGRPPTRIQNLEQLVASCVRDAFGDASTAAQLLQDRIHGNRKALKELTAPLLAHACLQAVSARIRANRPPEDDWSKDEHEEPDTSERLFALAKSNLDFRLPSGIILRDAFVHDVRDGAIALRKRAARAAKYAAWLESIAARMPKHRTVGDILDEPTLATLLEES